MISLERITPENALVYKAIRLRALQDAPLAFGSTYARESHLSDADWLKRSLKLASHQAIGYLAMDEGNPCGIVVSFFDKQNAERAQVLSMWVAPTHRRTGVGTTLIGALQNWSVSRGVRELQLMVTSVNRGAIGFYQHLGFQMSGSTEPYPNDPAIIEYEMLLPIESVQATRT